MGGPEMVIFRVDEALFHKLPEACFSIVIARRVMQPKHASPTALAIGRHLSDAIEGVRARFANSQVKLHADIVPYRDAFHRLGINPNKFPSSIEAMVSRIAKGGSVPSINPAVDLANISGLNHVVPVGVHDLDRCSGTIEVRMAREGDIFTPFGTTISEAVDTREPVYADSQEIRTRRWIWRQGEYSKATAASANLFYPIDGLRGANEQQILQARSELAAMLHELTGATVLEGWVDSENRSLEME
jgi:DNA/RNA-binding domain of Phe-tRNA-synthetase-like protein